MTRPDQALAKKLQEKRLRILLGESGYLDYFAAKERMKLLIKKQTTRSDATCPEPTNCRNRGTPPSSIYPVCEHCGTLRR